MFWLIRFGKTPCFKSIFFVSVHRAKGDSTLQHIPAELQIRKWAAGTIDLLEKIRIQTPHSFLPPSPHFMFITHAKSCLCMHKVPWRDFSAQGLQNLPFTTCYRCLKGYVQARIPRKVGVETQDSQHANWHTSWQKFCETFHFQ